MSENNHDTDTNDNSLITHDDQSVTLSKDRQFVALTAAWEIEAVAAHLLALVNDTDDMAQLVKRGLCVRIKDLAGVVNNAIDPGGDRLERLQAKVGITSR